MKKLLLIVLVFCACSNRPPYQNAIIDYCRTSLAAAANYEPVSFGNLVTTFNDASTSPEYARMQARVDSLQPLVRYSITHNQVGYKELSNALNTVADSLHYYTLNFKGDKVTGYSAEHTFKIKTATGATETEVHRFIFDVNKKVTTME